MKTFFCLKKVTVKDLLDKFNAILTPLTKNIPTPVKKGRKIRFFDFAFPQYLILDTYNAVLPSLAIFFTNFPKDFVHSRGVSENELCFQNKLFVKKVLLDTKNAVLTTPSKFFSQSMWKFLSPDTKFF